jgi:hypothetical protein
MQKDSTMVDDLLKLMQSKAHLQAREVLKQQNNKSPNHKQLKTLKESPTMRAVNKERPDQL